MVLIECRFTKMVVLLTGFAQSRSLFKKSVFAIR